MNPNYFSSSPNYQKSQDYPSFQSFFNTEDYQNSQYSQFSSNLNQIPIPEHIQTSENISRNLFKDANSKVGKATFSEKEDIALMSSWIFVSEDKICGRNQKVESLWARIHKLYEEVRKESPGEINARNKDSLKGHYNRLNTSANKWVAGYKEAYFRRRSGMNEQDIEREAQSIYSADGPKFGDFHVFNEVMCKHPKWEINLDRDSTRVRIEDNEDNEESGGSSKRSRTNEDGAYSVPTNPETPGSGGSTISRPTGRDIAKAKRKGKGKASQYSFDATEVAVEIRALRLTRDAEVEVMNYLGKERSVLERDRMKYEILKTLLVKAHFSPEEEQMKLRLIAYFNY